jgi:hypothetical protein
MFEVAYGMESAASPNIATEKITPSVNPKKMLATIRPEGYEPTDKDDAAQKEEVCSRRKGYDCEPQKEQPGDERCYRDQRRVPRKLDRNV